MNNRIIKFRAWNDAANRFSKPFTPFYTLLNYTDDDGLGVHKSLTDEVICQFTGLQDINGVDIYEGDIVNYGDANIKYVITFENGAFIGNQVGNKSKSGWFYYADSSTIMGNIHENPELLEGAA